MENQTTASLDTEKAKGLNLFSIKPYGNNLCTPGARYWITCIRLVIIVMALSEAIAWGYLGSLFGREWVGFLAAGIAFTFVFLIIWIIDVSFVTLDLSRAYYDKEILKKDASSGWDNAKVSAGLLGRVAIVVVSLSISAPFLAQIVFMQDIDNEMERRNVARVDAMSDSLLAAKDQEVAALDTLILEKEGELIVETAGRGASGNYGFGPVTQAMERNIQRLKDERTAKLDEKEELSESFKTLTTEEFADQYNVDLVDNGVQARAFILNSLTENPEYRAAKNAVTAFLAFIFAALVLLKLFQPRSVRIYYNEKLQDLFQEYLRGNLNKWISKEEQYQGDGVARMSPLRFEDWSINTYGVVRSEDIKRRESSKLYNTFKLKIEQLESEKLEIQKMMEPIEQDYERHVEELNDIMVEVLQTENAVEQNERDGMEIQRQLDGIDQDLKKGSFAGGDLLHAVQAKKNAELRSTDNKANALRLKHERDIVNHRYEVKKGQVDQLEDLLGKIRSNHRYIQEQIDRERLAYTDMIISGKVAETQRTIAEADFLEPNVDFERDVELGQEEERTEVPPAYLPEEGRREKPDEDVSDEPLEVGYETEEVGEREKAELLETDLDVEKVGKREKTDPFAVDLEAEEANEDEDAEPVETRKAGVDPFAEEKDFWDAYASSYEGEEKPEAVRDQPEHAAVEEADDDQQVLERQYPLLLNGRKLDEEQKEGLVDYVDDEQLSEYADAASLAAYDEDERERQDRETDVENEEQKDADPEEEMIPMAAPDAPEADEEEQDKEYSEESSRQPFVWIRLDGEPSREAATDQSTGRIPYAWDDLDTARSDEEESDNDEHIVDEDAVEEGAEEKDQPANPEDSRETAFIKDFLHRDAPEEPGRSIRGQRTRRPSWLKRSMEENS